MGFHNAEEILRSAEKLDPQEPSVKHINQPYLASDLYNDPDQIGYQFTIVKSENNWRLEQIDAAVQLDTTRNTEGVLMVGRTYQNLKEFLPTKEMIRQSVLLKVKIAKIAEQQHLNMQASGPRMKR